MNELKEQIRKLLVDNGCRLDNDSAVSRTVDLLATYTAQKELEARIDELGRVQLNYGHYKAQTFIKNGFISVEDRYNQLSSQLKDIK